MVDLDADLAAIFEGDDLDQVDAVFTTTGGTVNARGFFTNPTDGVTVSDTRIEASEPTFMGLTSDLESVARRDTVVINGDTYSVEKNQRVGDGMSVCYLKT